MVLSFDELESVKKVELEILLELDRICKKQNIKYQLFGGTLLGAVRHHGFIPWDDDIDVCMLRNDYNNFIKACENGGLASAFFLQTNKTNPSAILQFAKIRKNGTIFKSVNDCDEKIHTGIFIDVFPLDNVFPKSFIGKMQYKLYDFWYKVVSSSDFNRVKHAKSVANRVIRFFFFVFSLLLTKKRVDNILNAIATMFNNLNTDYVNHLTNGTQGKRTRLYLRTKKSVLTSIDGIFEGYRFPIPVDYDNVLKQCYGDYLTLPPESQRIPGHDVIKIKF